MRVRIQWAKIQNIRNVVSGEIKFPHREELFTMKSDVVGIYGQNGSGKTTFIYVLELLQRILSGLSVAEWATDCISYGADHGTISCEFSVEDSKKRRFRVLYTAELGANDLNESIKASVLEGESWSRLNDILSSQSSD